MRPEEKTEGLIGFLLKMLVFSLGTAVILVLLHCFMVPKMHDATTYFESKTTDAAVGQTLMAQVILDAGHGGEDGGASSKDGILEKDLNLQIAQKTGGILSQLGIDVIYTRTEDVSLNMENIKGKHKLYDLKNRLVIANEHPEAVFLSIHMNTFSQQKYWGMQVFYSCNHSQSQVLADRIQAANRALLQPDNERVTKPATSSIYLLDRCQSPAVLAECGFLSNPEEAQRLANEEEQQKIGAMLASVLCEYLQTIK